MAPTDQHVFGYGSLVEPQRGVVAQLRGYRRVWGVAMDNRLDIAGYKSYRLRSDGSRPGVHVAFVDIEPHAPSVVTGVCIRVDESDFQWLDDRERNYDRVDVTAAVEGAPGRIWAYRGSKAGRARLRDAVRAGRAVVSRAYLERVLASVGSIAPAEAFAIERSLVEGGVRVLELDRVEIRAGAAASVRRT